MVFFTVDGIVHVSPVGISVGGCAVVYGTGSAVGAVVGSSENLSTVDTLGGESSCSSPSYLFFCHIKCY